MRRSPPTLKVFNMFEDSEDVEVSQSNYDMILEPIHVPNNLNILNMLNIV